VPWRPAIFDSGGPNGVPCPPGTTGGAAASGLAPPGIAEATWLKAGAAEVQPSGTDNAPSEAARPAFAVTAVPPKSGEPTAPAPGFHPPPSADSNAGSPLPRALVPDCSEYMSDAAEPGAERLDVDTDADEVIPDTRPVPEVSTVDEDVAVVNADSGDDDETDVAADASPCTALGIAAVVSGDTIELSGDTTCMPVPAVVPATCVAAAAIPVEPAALVLCAGAVNGISVDAADDAPA
jgi:hypothetical protein